MFHKIACAMNVRTDGTARPDRGSGSAIDLHDVRRARKAQSAVASSALIKPIPNNKGKAGTGIGGSVIGLIPVLLPGSTSPPPDTIALFASVPVASGAILAVTVMSG